MTSSSHFGPLPLKAMAHQLRVPAIWLRREAEAGRIPHLQAGRALLFDPVAVEAAVVKMLREAALKGGKSND